MSLRSSTLDESDQRVQKTSTPIRLKRLPVLDNAESFPYVQASCKSNSDGQLDGLEGDSSPGRSTSEDFGAPRRH
jgi:hypothetical protein